MEKILFKTIVNLMNKVDSFIDMNGKEKKVYVMNEVRQILTQEVYERYEPMIDILIDGIVSVSRKTVIIALNKRKVCLSCIPK